MRQLPLPFSTYSCMLVPGPPTPCRRPCATWPRLPAQPMRWPCCAVCACASCRLASWPPPRSTCTATLPGWTAALPRRWPGACSTPGSRETWRHAATAAGPVPAWCVPSWSRPRPAAGMQGAGRGTQRAARWSGRCSRLRWRPGRALSWAAARAPSPAPGAPPAPWRCSWSERTHATPPLTPSTAARLPAAPAGTCSSASTLTPSQRGSRCLLAPAASGCRSPAALAVPAPACPDMSRLLVGHIAGELLACGSG
jgi:hypothetical protein